MPRGLVRYQASGHSHFVTFSCYRRQPFFHEAARFELFLRCLEEMRRRFTLCLYAYVVMPEHVHLLLSEPKAAVLAEALHFLKLSFTKRLGASGSFWQKRYYDRNVRDHREFVVKIGYIHRNPVKRGLVRSPEEWKWSSAHVAQPSSAASSSTVPVRVPRTGGETPPQLAGEDACATIRCTTIT